MLNQDGRTDDESVSERAAMLAEGTASRSRVRCPPSDQDRCTRPTLLTAGAPEGAGARAILTAGTVAKFRVELVSDFVAGRNHNNNRSRTTRNQLVPVRRLLLCCLRPWC
jgi:hypothetical protein